MEEKKEIKIHIERNENGNMTTQNLGFNKSSAKREVHSNTSLPQETRETSNKQPNFTSKATIKRRKEELQSQQKEINHKIKVEINEKVNEQDCSKNQQN